MLRKHTPEGITVKKRSRKKERKKGRKITKRTLLKVKKKKKKLNYNKFGKKKIQKEAWYTTIYI